LVVLLYLKSSCSEGRGLCYSAREYMEEMLWEKKGMRSVK